jgi:peptidoglycan/xylan/chitin deacetylase (PgdA/CDA1 family)
MFKFILAAVGLAVLAACATPEPAAPPATPIRFLLSFDDGPAPSTARVLDTLSKNPIQPGIKALFFVQTRAPEAGGGAPGVELMRRQHAAGHVLGVHSGTPLGHISHMALSPEELAESLEHAKSDIASITGVAPRFVRPPFNFYGDSTLKIYDQAGLSMLLADINPRDGTLLGINLVPAKRMIVRAHLERIKHELRQGELPVVDGATPVVVIFHDVNTTTAENLDGYLQMLVEEAHGAGIRVADRPFYDRPEELERAAGVRARQL